MIVKAVMVPHPPLAVHEIGMGRDYEIQDTLDAYTQACREIADAKPETVIVLSPHAIMYRDYFQISSGKEGRGSFRQFHAGQVKFRKEYDQVFTETLSRNLEEEGIAGGTDYDREPQLDHGTMVPLYFLDPLYTDYKLVRIGLSGQPLSEHYRFGQVIAKTAEQLGRRVAVIASGDLSHCQKEDGPYGLDPAGPEYDEKIMRTMGSAAFGELLEYSPEFLHQAQECGHRAFVILAGILDGMRVTPHVLSHEATFGVGYGIVTYDIDGTDENRRFLQKYEEEQLARLEQKTADSDAYVKLARASVERWVRTRTVLPIPRDLPEEMLEKQAGVFVSLHMHGDLRGCIGTILPVQDCIAEEIIRNGISACARDPRFSPVTVNELPWLEISVDVLTEPERIPDETYLDVRKYGVICTCRGRRGLLLPDLEGVDTIAEQISIACRKGGIDPADDDLVLERFEVIRHV